MASDKVEKFVERVITAYGTAGIVSAQSGDEKEKADAYAEARKLKERLVNYIAKLEESADTLHKLEAAGVDNWEGYSEAFKDDEEDDDDDEEE